MTYAKGILQVSFRDTTIIIVELMNLMSVGRLRSTSFRCSINSDFGKRFPKHLYMVDHLC